jgi:hypothetical protein
MEDWNLTTTTKEQPTTTPRFITRTRKKEEEEEEDQEDEFTITIDETIGTTDATQMGIPGQNISGSVAGTLNAEAIGPTEGAVIGATEGAWEGIGAGAFEGAVELNVTAATELTVIGDAELNLSGNTEGGEITIPSIQFEIPERHADTKWRMKPRYTEDQGTESTTNGTLIWNRPTQLGMEGPRWERNFQTAGIAILWKALDVIKQQTPTFPTSISDGDQNITQ